jgi:DNA topoisomerase VI subunit B
MKKSVNGSQDTEANNYRAERFQRLAERRVNEALKKLRLVANLSNKRNYTYTEEHAKLIIDALEAEFRHLKTKFRDEAGTDEIRFSLKDK